MVILAGLIAYTYLPKKPSLNLEPQRIGSPTTCHLFVVIELTLHRYLSNGVFSRIGFGSLLSNDRPRNICSLYPHAQYTGYIELARSLGSVLGNGLYLAVRQRSFLVNSKSIPDCCKPKHIEG